MLAIETENLTEKDKHFEYPLKTRSLTFEPRKLSHQNLLVTKNLLTFYSKSSIQRTTNKVSCSDETADHEML